MICRQLFAPPHCAGRVRRAWQWWHLTLRVHPGQGHFQPQHSAFSVPSSPPPSIYRHLLQQKSCLKHRKASFCHARGRAGQGAHQCRPLSASVCSLNGKISRKVLKVGTSDEKRIYGILKEADTSNFRCFMCALVTEMPGNFDLNEPRLPL